MEIDKAKLSAAVSKLQQGDSGAFSEIYSLTNQSAYFTALKITKNEDDAQDALQDAYMHMLGKVSELDKPESFMSWFNMIVANKAKDICRKNNKYFFVDEKTDDDGEAVTDFFESQADTHEEFKPGAGIEEDQLKEDVMALIDGLSDDKRTAILLYYYNELSTKQIAESMGVTEGTVKSRLYYARKDLEEGIKALQKKNKILGIAPISLVRWALKSSGDAAAEKNMQDMQQLFAKLQESYPHTGLSFFEKLKFNLTEFFGNIGNKFSGANDKGVDLRPVAAIVVTAGIVGGAVAGTNAVRNRSKADETTTAASTVQEVKTTKANEFVRSTPEERYGDVTVPEGRETDLLFSKEEAKYGVEIAYQDYAVAGDDGTEIVESKPIFSRSGFSASYEDLLPAAKENQKEYASEISSAISQINAERAENGLSPLTVNSTLSEQANVRAEEIAWSGRDNGIRPDGSYYTSVFEHNGMDSGTRLEVISANRTSSSAAIKEIIEDASVMGNYAEQIGVGVAKDPETDRLVYVVHLYSPTPSLAGTLPMIEDIIKSSRDDAVYGFAEEASDHERVEEIENMVADIPVVGDILLYDFDNDTELMEFNQAMENLAAKITAFKDSLEED